MDIHALEYAAQVVFSICREHPEICPHDYEWEWSQTKDDIEKKHYKCRLCGAEIVKEVNI